MGESDSISGNEHQLRDEIRRLRLENLDQKARLAELAEEKAILKQEQERLEKEQDRLRQNQARQKEEQKRLEKENDDLKAELARSRITSRNSSKRPSSDIVKPRGKRGASKLKIGGQPGHPLNERPPFVPESLDAVIEHKLSCCPDCQGPLRYHSGVSNTVQQMDIQPMQVRIEEHRANSYWCASCVKYHTAPLPPPVEKGGLCGPSLTALIAYLKGACHASYSTIQRFLKDVAGIGVSRGLLAKLIHKVSASLKGSHDELLELLASQCVLNVDETGHPENGEGLWTWCFRAEMFVLFKIDPSRGSQVLLEVLGEDFNGVLGCDYFSAYRKYMGDFGIRVQFCLAHLIRDVKFLLDLPDAQTKMYGRRLLDALRSLFGVVHRRESLSAKEFKIQLVAAREAILLWARTNVPPSREARNLAARFKNHGAAYFQFITTPSVEPTNNLAERAIRFIVIDRLVTQGTRGEKGRRWCERIWTAMGTCTIRSTSLFDYLNKAVHAHFNNQTPPSLLSSTT